MSQVADMMAALLLLALSELYETFQVNFAGVDDFQRDRHKLLRRCSRIFKFFLWPRAEKVRQSRIRGVAIGDASSSAARTAIRQDGHYGQSCRYTEGVIVVR